MLEEEMQHCVCSAWLKLVRQWLYLALLGGKEPWLRAVFTAKKEAAAEGKVFKESGLDRK